MSRRQFTAERHSQVDQAVDRALDTAERRIGRVVEQFPESVRPKLRGWLHLGAVPLSIALGVIAIALAPAGAVRWSVVVYVATTVLLFSVSAVYHRRIWGPRTEAVLKRLDHSNIYLFIAGSYTPFAVTLLSETQGRILLIAVWSVAALGVLFRVLWVGAPRPLYVALYIALGWVAIGYVPALWRNGGVAVALLILLGGLLYTLGAIVYTLRRPNPFPRWFGFHELFHSLTVAAYIAQFVAVLLVVTE
jgi:hemolysin III